MRVDSQLEARLLALSELDRAGLRGDWVAAFGRSPPNHVSLIFMRKALIWSAQAEGLGGLKAAHRRALAKAAGDGEIGRPKKRVASSAQLVRE